MKAMRSIKIIFLSLILFFFLPACEKGKEPIQPTSEKESKPVSSEITLEEGCSACHGAEGVDSKPGIPYLAGQPAQYLEKAMYSYLILDRKREIMRQAIFDIDAEKRRELANYFANSKAQWGGGIESEVVDSRTPDPSAIRAGKAISRSCSSCHGTDGNSVKTGVPSLAGLQPEYFVPAIKDYLNGQRKGAAIMKNFKLSLSEKDLNNLAAYYSVQQRQRSPLGAKIQNVTPSDKLVPRCVGCHGENGNSTHPAMPGLAGQNATYLIKAMQTYRAGERRNKMMTDVARGISDEDIERAAAYFATRTPAKISTATPTKKKVSAKFDPMGDGATLAASCNGCHGNKGNNPTSGAPRLAGLSYLYLQNAIAAYRDGKRKHQMMEALTRFLDETDIEKISYYYASQTPVISNKKTKIGNATSGKELAAGCAGCHGEDGNSQDVKIPSLAGQNASYLVSAINSYREKGSRDQSDMKGIAQELDKSAIKNLSQYFSQLTPEKSSLRTLEGPDVLSQKCDRCHGENGSHPDPEIPRIGGQKQTYLVNALKAYRKGDRIHTLMQAMTQDMWTVEIEAIAAYYAAK